MLVLALDTSTDAVVVGLAEFSGADRVRVLAEQARPGARQHGEQLMPAVLEVCAATEVDAAGIDAVVCGVGPGPFTGLRVGIASAAALADALGVPAHGVCSLDAVAAAVFESCVDGSVDGSVDGCVDGCVDGSVDGGAEPLLVVTDARRREVYWAAYAAGPAGWRRTHGPAVATPAALVEQLPGLGVRRVAGTMAEEHAELFGLPTHQARTPDVAGLIAVAAPALNAPALNAADQPGPLEPLYLRRPDAVPPAARKRVTVG